MDSICQLSIACHATDNSVNGLQIVPVCKILDPTLYRVQQLDQLTLMFAKTDTSLFRILGEEMFL